MENGQISDAFTYNNNDKKPKKILVILEENRCEGTVEKEIVIKKKKMETLRAIGTQSQAS